MRTAPRQSLAWAGAQNEDGDANPVKSQVGELHSGPAAHARRPEQALPYTEIRRQGKNPGQSQAVFESNDVVDAADPIASYPFSSSTRRNSPVQLLPSTIPTRPSLYTNKADAAGWLLHKYPMRVPLPVGAPLLQGSADGALRSAARIRFVRTLCASLRNSRRISATSRRWLSPDLGQPGEGGGKSQARA